MISASRQTPVQDAFRIGESHHVEPSLNSVIGPGGAIRLEPKVMQVLVCLATHTGQVVSKERLMHTVWPDTFVGDDVLTRAISELRHAFGDDAKHPRFIQTIAKRGYRLIPDCVGLTGTDSESRVDLLRPAPWKLTLRARWLVGSGAHLCLAESVSPPAGAVMTSGHSLPERRRRASERR